MPWRGVEARSDILQEIKQGDEGGAILSSERVVAALCKSSYIRSLLDTEAKWEERGREIEGQGKGKLAEFGAARPPRFPCLALVRRERKAGSKDRQPFYPDVQILRI